MPFELVPPGTHIDFIGKRRIAATLSLVLLLAGAIAIPINGVKLGIDFAGGTEIQIKFDPQVEVSEGPIRRTLGDVEGVENLLRVMEEVEAVSARLRAPRGT